MTRLLLCAALTLLVSWASMAPSAHATPRSWRGTLPAAVQPSQIEALVALDHRFGPINVAFDNGDGTVRWLDGVLSEALSADAEGLWAFVTQRAVLLRLEDPSRQLRLTEIRTDRYGMTHGVFQRVHRDIPVFASEFVVHMNPHGVVTSVTGRYHAEVVAPTVALLDQTQGYDAAHVHSGHPGPVQFHTDYGEGRLVIVGPRPDTPRSTGFQLAWMVGVSWYDQQPWAYRMFIDARSGDLLRKYAMVFDQVAPATGTGKSYTGQTVNLNVGQDGASGQYALWEFKNTMGSGNVIRTYNANNYTSQPEDTSYLDNLLAAGGDFTSSDGFFKDTASVDAHRFISAVYDYYATNHDWYSWDGQGAGLLVLVHVDNQLNNAFWHGYFKILAFGDGDGWNFLNLTRCLDIAGHELSHAVITGTVDLVYEAQSGALNEHIADAFGTLVDAPSGSPDDFHLGENCMGQGWSTPFLRHIKQPHLGQQPGHFFGYRQLPLDDNNGGVHSNSGIPNKAFSIMYSALGAAKLGQLYMAFLQSKSIGQTGTFLDYRNGMLSTCGAVFGASSTECNHVLAAMEQVGIFAQGSAVSCPSGSSPDTFSGCQCNPGTFFDYSTGVCGSPTNACSGVPAAGECSGSTLSKCVNGSVQTTDCAGIGKACAFDSITQQYTCSGDSGGCGNVTATKTCYGDVLKWCDNGSVQTQNCPFFGQVCSNGQCTTPDSSCTPNCGGKACGDDGCGGVCGVCGAGEQCDGAGQCQAASPEACGAITVVGECNGDTLSWCDNGNLVVINCASNNAPCVFDDSNQYYDCGEAQSSGGGPCGAVTVEGQCDGQVLNYCDEEGVLQTYDCAGLNATCAFDDANNYYNCLGAGSGACNGITFQGECQDDTVLWCDNDTLQSITCTDASKVCGWSETNDFYDCIDPSGLGTCVPACDGKTCGDDGCGGVCGTCADSQSCSASGQCLENLVPIGDEALCSGSGPHHGTWLLAAVLWGLLALRRRRRQDIGAP